MYGRDDLRATLATASTGKSPTSFKRSGYARFCEEPPSEVTDLSESWWCRGHSMVIQYCVAKAGEVLTRSGQPDEYAVLLPDDGTEVEIEIPEGSWTMADKAVAFVPAGESKVTVKKGGRVLRLFNSQAADLFAKCPNASDYAEPDPNCAPWAPWPDPVGGRKVRVYSGNVGPEEGRFGRIYRGSTIMVNFGDGRPGLRSLTNLSPHHHTDFEQYSVVLDGEYTHHLRWPWISDATQWIEDEHVRCGAPHVAIIPPPVTHTSQGLSDGLNRLLDVFSPPRMDFSIKPGWVLNADDYPMPEGGQ